MDAIAETPGVTKIKIFEYLDGKWSRNLTAIHACSVTTPETLIEGQSIKKFDKFYDKLQEWREEITSEYMNFIQSGVIVRCDEMIEVLMRFNFKRYCYALDRYIGELNKWRQNVKFDKKKGTFHPTGKQSSELIMRMCIPHISLYHNKSTGITRMTDIHQYLFMNGMHRHIAALQGTKRSEAGYHFSRDALPSPSHSVIYHGCKSTNAILEYIAELSSYPVLPSGMVGRSIGSRCLSNAGVELKMMEPGVDAKTKEREDDVEQVCVRCRVQNALTGVTDKTEIYLRTVCNCATISTLKGDENQPYTTLEKCFIDAYVNRKASTVVRLFELNLARWDMTSCFGEHLGCYCKQHAKNAFDAFVNNKRLLQEARLL